jgi:hypothetical protein
VLLLPALFTTSLPSDLCLVRGPAEVAAPAVEESSSSEAIAGVGGVRIGPAKWENAEFIVLGVESGVRKLKVDDEIGVNRSESGSGNDSVMVVGM